MVKLLGFASRWAGHRGRLTSRFEIFEDLIAEAASLSENRRIDAAAVLAARDSRHRRNARIEDRLQEGIEEQSVLIDTTGSVVGQINALTVRDMKITAVQYVNSENNRHTSAGRCRRPAPTRVSQRLKPEAGR